jgi:hypothetical protein
MTNRETPSLLRDGLEAFFHWPTLLVITAFSLLVSIHSPQGFIIIDSPTLAITILSISGTMVALVLPAAELAHGFVDSLENQLAKILRDPVDPQKKIDAVDKITANLKANLYPAWRASIYALTSFLLSIVGFLLPKWTIPLWGQLMLAVDELAVIVSLAFLASAALWFFPSARYAFRFQVLDKINKAVRAIAELEQEKPTDAPES